ncbi:MAG: glycoside hydrolase family 32 protein, partial [Promethearchaeota archaeon]
MDRKTQLEMKAKECHHHPSFHFRCPAGWMNDPNGTIYLNGKYHLFYQHHPYSEDPGPMHWGHASSLDLIHWKHHPIAIKPSFDLGEIHCFSGCCFNNDGVPTILYTSINESYPPKVRAEQWAAISKDPDLIVWKKDPKNPILDLSINGDLLIEDWRDPYIVPGSKSKLLVLGGHEVNKDTGEIKYPVALLYEMIDIHSWKFLGFLCTGNDGKLSNSRINIGRNWECPNFFPIDASNKIYTLIVSPHDRVIYSVGKFINNKYYPESWHIFDHGSCYYATNTYFAPDGRIFVVGWVRGMGNGWKGLTSLPREVYLDKGKNKLRIRPIQEFKSLREEHVSIPEVKLSNDDVFYANNVSGLENLL